MNTTPIDNVLAHFEGVTKAGAGWTAICPAHPDDDSSLRVDVRADGAVQLACGFPDCTVGDVLEAAGLNIGDLMPNNGDGTTDGPDPPATDAQFMPRETARALLPAIEKPVDELLLEWAAGVVKMTPAKRAKERSEKIAVLTGLFADPEGMVDGALEEAEHDKTAYVASGAPAGPFNLTELGERLNAWQRATVDV